MNNTGKDLEDYVRTILGSLLPLDFTISPRVREHNEKGIQVNEFDIVINGKMFTYDFKWLIECRDRPSQGPAPRRWIENLVARRQLNKFDKVTAVSTTGFSSGAFDLAKDQRIGTYHVKTFDPENLLDWFKNNQILYIRPLFKVNYVALFTQVPNEEDNELLSALMINTNIHSKILSFKENPNKISLKFACDDALRQIPEMEKLIDDNLKLMANKLRFDVEYSNPDFQYHLNLDDKKIIIRKIVFIGDFQLEQISLPILKVKQYISEEDESIVAESAFFKLNIDDKNVDLAFHKVKEKDQIKIFATRS